MRRRSVLASARAVGGAVLLLLLPACTREPTAARGPAQQNDTTGTPAPVAPAVPTLGLIEAPGYELVVRHCVICHGPRQFLQQRGDREVWLGLIRWMQRDHGLMPLLPEVEHGIVDYLSTHYGPQPASRRRAIPTELMPPNPYAAGN